MDGAARAAVRGWLGLRAWAASGPRARVAVATSPCSQKSEGVAQGVGRARRRLPLPCCSAGADATEPAERSSTQA